jgi:hypothetical protein
VKRCAYESTCPEGAWCDITPVAASWLACMPTGDREAGEGCGDDPWSCGEELHCVGVFHPEASVTEPSWSVCAKPCGGAYTKAFGPCGEAEECRYLARGRAYCMPAGELGVGDACTGTPHACAKGTHCVPGSDGTARCLVPCLPGVTCPAETTCQETSPGPLLFCTPDGFESGAWWEPYW